MLSPGTADRIWPGVVVHPFPTLLILTDEGTRYDRHTDHPEGLRGNTSTIVRKQPKRLILSVFQIWLTPLKGEQLDNRWSLATASYSNLLKGWQYCHLLLGDLSKYYFHYTNKYCKCQNKKYSKFWSLSYLNLYDLEILSKGSPVIQNRYTKGPKESLLGNAKLLITY